MRIHLVSDTHATILNPYAITDVGEDVTVECGDMGLCLTLCTDKLIIVVKGNHDYYQNKYKPYRKVKVVGEYVFISCTLWTNFWGKDLKLGQWQQLNDFHYIEDMGVDRMKDEYKQDLAFIKKNIKKYSDKKVIICTHFPPSKKAIEEKYKSHPLNKYFVNDLDNFIIENKNIKAWLFGHVHSSHDFRIGNCRCVCNAKGYNNENHKFDNKLIIEID